jgi:hypothetical protein
VSYVDEGSYRVTDIRAAEFEKIRKITGDADFYGQPGESPSDKELPVPPTEPERTWTHDEILAAALAVSDENSISALREMLARLGIDTKITGRLVIEFEAEIGYEIHRFALDEVFHSLREDGAAVLSHRIEYSHSTE